MPNLTEQILISLIGVWKTSRQLAILLEVKLDIIQTELNKLLMGNLISRQGQEVSITEGGLTLLRARGYIQQ